MYAPLIALLTFAAVSADAQSEAWKTEIDNSMVRVSRRVLAPHEKVSVADSAPALFVFLTDVRGKRCQCFWSSDGKISLENPGEERVDVARIVPKFSPDASYQLLPVADPLRVVFENDLMRMRRIGPRAANAQGSAVGRLQHPAASVLIELTAAHLRLRHTDGRLEVVDRKAGDIWFQPEDPFYPESVGAPGHEVLRIELKGKEAKP